MRKVHAHVEKSTRKSDRRRVVWGNSNCYNVSDYHATYAESKKDASLITHRG